MNTRYRIALFAVSRAAMIANQPIWPQESKPVGSVSCNGGYYNTARNRAQKVGEGRHREQGRAGLRVAASVSTLFLRRPGVPGTTTEGRVRNAALAPATPAAPWSRPRPSVARPVVGGHSPLSAVQ